MWKKVFESLVQKDRDDGLSMEIIVINVEILINDYKQKAEKR